MGQGDAPVTAATNPRRVLVAVVRGEVGERIQAWREEFDPRQARRLPPHLTLAYRAEIAPEDEDRFDRQVRHAFPVQIPVRLGEARQFDNPDGTFYVAVEDTGALDTARVRLFDGTHVVLPEQRQTWEWHITVIRYGIKVDLDLVRPHLDALRLQTMWRLDAIAWLELRGGMYHELRRWDLR
jgi:2'-5' RNA ligase